RRRHTRSKRDWSSDVCSSDLRATFSARSPPLTARRHTAARTFTSSFSSTAKASTLPITSILPTKKSKEHRAKYTKEDPPFAALRSEERRVGKECRNRRQPSVN